MHLALVTRASLPNSTRPAARKMRASDDADSAAVNASSASQTMASGSNTHGTLNQHPDQSFVSQAQTSGLSTKLAGPEGKLPFRVGVAEDRNKRWRRTMEDSHAFVYDYGGVRGQGFFGVFDGHAGKHAAEWCGKNFHNVSAEEDGGQPYVP